MDEAFYTLRYNKHREILDIINPYKSPDMGRAVIILKNAGSNNEHEVVAKAIHRSDIASMTVEEVIKAYAEAVKESSLWCGECAQNNAIHDAAMNDLLADEYAEHYSSRPSSRKLAGMIYSKEKYQLTGESFEFKLFMQDIYTPHSSIYFRDIGYTNLPNYAAVVGMARVLGNLILAQLKADNPGADVKMTEEPGGELYVKISYRIYRLKKEKPLQQL